ncbi:MAG: DUF1553 domain-containing protein [Planctomycetaceae bacterium]|nr:DUF1553 domain-containing protein [Planctomycetaceae bacterium]
MLRCSVRTWGVILLGWLVGIPVLAEENTQPNFNRDIRPLLADRCFSCHGPDAESREADLRLDDRQAAEESGIFAADAGESELWQRITSEDDDYRMPPPDSNKPRLNSEQLARVKNWLQTGAEYDIHWSLMPPHRPALPAVQAVDWCANPIDRFVLARQERNSLSPAMMADRVTLIRRLYFDLIGLPPEPDVVDAFVANQHPQAYAQTVDRLLASPRFGERMAIYWLDLVRFANSVGYHGDQEHAIDPYRDYVIAAFNDNLSFDQFTIEQLAGDLLTNPTQDQLIATGYNRLLQTSHEGGVQQAEYLAKYSADRVRNVSAAWMGATLGCAECHDHKFDQFPQRDFYRLAAFFADVDDLQTFRGSNSTPTQRLPELTVLSRVDRHRVNDLLRRIERLASESDGADNRVAELKKRVEELQSRALRTMVTKAIDPRVIRVLDRGDWMDESGEIVRPGVPDVLPDLPDLDRRATRLDLARWLTDVNHPLTARVFVNRIWSLVFGVGISRNLEDLGSQGEWPTHPDLLDWLASEFVESDWDIKQLVRQIVLSKTYRQSSVPTTRALENDPANRLFTRAERFRLSAELVRDSLLSVSGLLVLDDRVASARPLQPTGYYAHLNFPPRRYEPDQDSSQYRRGVYMHWQRQFLHPMLKAFDAPSREECTSQRSRSNTPQAALTLLNDPCLVEAAITFATRALRQTEDDKTVTDQRDLQQIIWMWQEALSRKPLHQEALVLMRLLAENRNYYEEHPAAARQLLPAELDSMQQIEVAAWTAVARTILNLGETLTRN